MLNDWHITKCLQEKSLRQIDNLYAKWVNFNIKIKKNFPWNNWKSKKYVSVCVRLCLFARFIIKAYLMLISCRKVKNNIQYLHAIIEILANCRQLFLTFSRKVEQMVICEIKFLLFNLIFTNCWFQASN